MVCVLRRLVLVGQGSQANRLLRRRHIRQEYASAAATCDSSCACAKRALATARTLAREAVQLSWSAWTNVVASPADSRSTGSGQALSWLRRMCCPWVMVHGLCSPGIVQPLCRTHTVQGHCAFTSGAKMDTSLQVGAYLCCLLQEPDLQLRPGSDLC